MIHQSVFLFVHGSHGSLLFTSSQSINTVGFCGSSFTNLRHSSVRVFSVQSSSVLSWPLVLRSSAARVTPNPCHSSNRIFLRYESHGTVSTGSQFIHRSAFTLRKSFTASPFQRALRFCAKSHIWQDIWKSMIFVSRRIWLHGLFYKLATNRRNVCDSYARSRFLLFGGLGRLERHFL